MVVGVVGKLPIFSIGSQRIVFCMHVAAVYCVTNMLLGCVALFMYC